jgi:hypothetical protein
LASAALLAAVLAVAVMASPAQAEAHLVTQVRHLNSSGKCLDTATEDNKTVQI